MKPYHPYTDIFVAIVTVAMCIVTKATVAGFIVAMVTVAMCIVTMVTIAMCIVAMVTIAMCIVAMVTIASAIAMHLISGVDDVFVFVNTFRQACHLEDLGDRMVHTLMTAGKATFFTSFTTAAAFAANVASSVSNKFNGLITLHVPVLEKIK